MSGFARFTIRLDDADVLVNGTTGGRDFDGANEHVVIITTITILVNNTITIFQVIPRRNIVTTFCGSQWC